MKKVLFGAFALCFSVASAEDNDSESARKAYEGWNIAAGVSYQYIMNDVLLSDNYCVFGARDAHDLSLIKSRGGKTGGSLSVDWGLFPTGNAYVGAGLTLDVTGNKTSSRRDIVVYYPGAMPDRVDYGYVSVKTRGFVPTLALKFGGLASWAGCSLMYARFGLALVHGKFEPGDFFKDQGFSFNKVSPVVGFGIEKNFGGCGIRVEGDYRFSANKKRSGLRNSGVDPDYQACVEDKVRGYVIRVLGVYYFN